MNKNINKHISTFSHDIKNPLHSAAINIEVIRTRLSRSAFSEAKELLKHAEIVDKEIRKLERTINAFLQKIEKS